MIPYVSQGETLFRFMDERRDYFWPSIKDMLSASQLFLNSRTNFNDPFDSQPVVVQDLKDSAIRNYFAKVFENPFHPKRSPERIAQILKLKSEGKTRLNKDQIDLMKDRSYKNAFEYIDKCGLASFSRTAENPLLWGHYAASFTGVCAVFKRGRSPDSILAMCADVKYVTERPKLPLSLIFALGSGQMLGDHVEDIANEVFFLSFLQKDAHWSYEREARIFFPFSAFGKQKFEPDELVAMIIGPKASPELKKRLRDNVENYRPGLAIHVARLSESEFRILLPDRF